MNTQFNDFNLNKRYRFENLISSNSCCRILPHYVYLKCHAIPVGRFHFSRFDISITTKYLSFDIAENIIVTNFPRPILFRFVCLPLPSENFVSISWMCRFENEFREAMLVGNFRFRSKVCCLPKVAVTLPKKKKIFLKPFSIYYSSKWQRPPDVSGLTVLIFKSVAEN